MVVRRDEKSQTKWHQRSFDIVERNGKKNSSTAKTKYKVEKGALKGIPITVMRRTSSWKNVIIFKEENNKDFFLEYVQSAQIHKMICT